MKNDHICEFISTGEVLYSGPLKYVEKCNVCDKIRWKTEKSISDKTIVYEYPQIPEKVKEDLNFFMEELLKAMDK